jgi:hypothetical protein
VSNANFTVGSAAAGRKKKLGPWHIEFKLQAVDRAEAMLTVNFTARLVNFTAIGSIKFMVGTAAAGREQLGPWHMDCSLDAVDRAGGGDCELYSHAVDRAGGGDCELHSMLCERHSTWQFELHDGNSCRRAGRSLKLVPWHMDCCT